MKRPIILERLAWTMVALSLLGVVVSAVNLYVASRRWRP